MQEWVQDFIQSENRASDNNDNNNNPIFLNKNLLNVCANLNVNIQRVEQADHVYVVWTDTSNGGDTDIFFRATTMA
ncbi:MAG: hypothetical protein WCB31_10945 [Nitrososphaeraceae archaeon]